MAETTDFVSRISVKDLISAFENRSETVRVEFSRPRARSFGNVLNKNVVVRLNEYTTLEDIEKGLSKLETSLNFYEVYNKAKHVSFQEQFFNILTSIANIENENENAPNRKKRLISRTQTLVSFLNQKLPANIHQVVEPKSSTQYKYTPKKAELDATGSEEPKLSNGDSQLYAENSGSIDITDSGEQYIVSVKKLKENFQKNVERIELQKSQTAKSNQKESVPSNSPNTPTTDVKKIDDDDDDEPVKEKNPTIDERVEPISVTKLRSLFEQRSEENSKGLEIITIDKPLMKTSLGGSAQNINFPYTERNLGNLRLQRSVSGNYMNYRGLLKRVDINRSNSVLELNKESTKFANEDSGAESDESEEVKENSATIYFVREPVKTFSEKEQVSITEFRNFEVIKDKNPTEQEAVEHNTSNGTEEIESPPESPNEYLSLSSEDGDIQGCHKEESIYSKASADDNTQYEEINVTENELSYQGVDIIEVNSGTAVSENVPQVEESTSKLEATVEELPSSESEVVKENGDNTKVEHVSSFKEIDETEVNYSVEAEENISRLEAPTEISHSTSILDLDDDRERSLIDEVIEKIDVEQTLANADLHVNPEDLKNADDEFEKLIESNGTGKLIA